MIPSATWYRKFDGGSFDCTIFDPYPPTVGSFFVLSFGKFSRQQPLEFQQNAPLPLKVDIIIWQFCPPPLTKYPLDTIFTDQTKGVLFVGVVKYSQKFTIVYSNIRYHTIRGNTGFQNKRD